MNLFWIRAAFLADCHVVKMPLEYAQLLSTTYYFYEQIPPSGYKKTHAGHPCTIWTAQSARHWHTVAQLAFAALREYTRRFGRVHKCWFKIAAMVRCPPVFHGKPPCFKPETKLAEMGDFIDVPLCMPKTFHHPRATVAYAQYYLNKLRTVPKCARWNRDDRRFMHFAAVTGYLRTIESNQLVRKRKRL